MARTLSFKGSTITASLDGTVVKTLTDTSYKAGQVGIGTSQNINAQFDNLRLSPTDGGGRAVHCGVERPSGPAPSSSAAYKSVA